MQEQKKPKKQFSLQHLQTIGCGSGMQYPYHPLLSIIDIKRDVYLAYKMRDGIEISIMTEKGIERSYSLDTENLPRSAITSLQLIPADVIEQKKQDVGPMLYLLVGFNAGYLYLLKAFKKEIKVLYRYNRVIQPEAGLLSKTFSYFYSNTSNEYTIWQKAAVIRVIQRKQSLVYLLRSNTLVHLNSLAVPADQLQKKFEQFSNDSKLLKHNSMEKAGNFTYFIGKEWKMLRNSQGAIITFEMALASLFVTDDRIIVGSFDGDLLFFDRASMVCVDKILVSVSIKTITNCNNSKYICLCLQDDTVQVLNLTQNCFLNIVGHRSFTSQCALIDPKTILIASFDGTISLTQIPQLSEWNPLGKKLITDNTKECVVNERYQVGRRQTGVGNMVLHRDFVVLAMMDSCIKIYRLNKDAKEIKEIKEVKDSKDTQQVKDTKDTTDK